MRINKLIGYSALIVVGILLIATIRGCQRSKSDEGDIKELMALTDSSIAVAKRATSEWAEAKKQYKDSLEFIQGQWDLSKNRELALNEDLGKANDRITILLKKHVPIKPSLSDTGIITVPMEYVRDCEGCYDELANGQQLVLKYKAEKDNQFQILSGKTSIKDNRISFLEKSNTTLGESNSALLSNIKTLQDKWMPKGRMYLSLGALWNFAPYAVGAGLMYQDNRFRQYGAKVYFGSFGKMVETNINMPLSFKRR